MDGSPTVKEIFNTSFPLFNIILDPKHGQTVKQKYFRELFFLFDKVALKAEY